MVADADVPAVDLHFHFLGFVTFHRRAAQGGRQPEQAQGSAVQGEHPQAAPGQEPVQTRGMGYSLPQGSDLVLRIQYKKTWITEGQEFSDQSRVGLYAADGAAASIESLLVTSPEAVSGREVTITHDVEQNLSLLALLPEIDIESSEIRIEAVTPDGSRIPMLWLREPDSGWTTRFWLDAPVSLPEGSRLEIRATLDPAAERLPSTPLLGSAAANPIRIAVDYVAGDVAAN